MAGEGSVRERGIKGVSDEYQSTAKF
jgi:hypothetical protein